MFGGKSLTIFSVLLYFTSWLSRLHTYVNSFKRDNVEPNLMFYKVLNVISFYEKNVKNTSVFVTYGEKFIFFWKGEKKIFMKFLRTLSRSF